MSINRKGIILSGGSGSRLYPATNAMSKQLLPVYDKPMIYYPISTLMLAGIREILIICTPEDINNFKRLLSDGSQWGLTFEYAIQKTPDGLAKALIIGEDFLNGSPSALILGDNIFYGQALVNKLKKANNSNDGATIFGYKVKDPQRFGVVDFDKNKKVISIEEKPVSPKSNYIVTGLYFYDKKAPEYSKQLRPSARGELEITDLNKLYLKNNQLSLENLGRNYKWIDTGTYSSLLKANELVKKIQIKQSIKIGCPEKVAFSNNWICKETLYKTAKTMIKNSYGQYLMELIKKSEIENN